MLHETFKGKVDETNRLTSPQEPETYQDKRIQTCVAAGVKHSALATATANRGGNGKVNFEPKAANENNEMDTRS